MSSAFAFLIRPQISVLAAQQHPPQRQKDVCPDTTKGSFAAVTKSSAQLKESLRTTLLSLLVVWISLTVLCQMTVHSKRRMSLYRVSVRNAV